MVDVDRMIKGLKDLLSDEKLSMTERDLRATMAAFHVRLGWREAQSAKVPDNVSYGIGVDIAGNLRRHGFKVDIDLVIKGLRDTLSAEKFPMTEEELRAVMAAYQARLKQSRMEGTRVAALDSKKEGAFLTENRMKEGVETLMSGLQYKILKPGEGKRPSDGDTVEVHYRGTFVDGTEFDSSYRTGQPVTFKVAGAIPGWREALTLMPSGSKWQLFIPPHLAFRSGGWGLAASSGPTLIFQLELLGVVERSKK